MTISGFETVTQRIAGAAMRTGECAMRESVPTLSLFTQLGGTDNITAVVDDFYGRVLADDTLSPLFAGVDLDKLRRHQAQFIAHALGGPHQYQGRTMRVVHAGLGITAAQFAAVAGHLAESLSAFAVPHPVIDQVIQHVAQLQAEIVQPTTPPLG